MRMWMLCVVAVQFLGGCTNNEFWQKDSINTVTTEPIPGSSVTVPKSQPSTPSSRSEPMTGQVMTNSIGMKLIWVPSGEFQMGSNEYDNEKPVHTVMITKGFWIGQCEVTQEQYEKVMEDNPSKYKGVNLPVEDVTWNDAVKFCKNLSAKEGKIYRLPTEAEWEYACRAGSSGRFCFGESDNQLSEYAWYYSNSGDQTHPVGQKKPNAWNLYDMHGNVWEWCQDMHARDWYSKCPLKDPLNERDGDKNYRILRGGGWFNGASYCRVSSRRYGPINQYNDYGFRVVVDF